MAVSRRGGPEVIRGRVEPGPVFVAGELRIPWEELGPACIGAELIVSYDQPDFGSVREPVDDEERQRWEDAVALLDECLPAEKRLACPLDDLTLAAKTAREGEGAVWELISDLGGWAGMPPDDDEDLFTGAAMALVSVASDRLDLEAGAALDSMELNEWLAMVIELVRCGPGCQADPDTLVALAARCLEVDSAAADPKAGPAMRNAFSAVVPVWEALGAVDAEGKLTALGAWGIPRALARAWGGELAA